MTNKKINSKFYSKSLTLMIPILESINRGIICADIAKKMNMHKSHIAYYTKKLQETGFIEKTMHSSFAEFRLTQSGKKFLDQYQKTNAIIPILRLENIQFIAEVIEMPKIPVDWKKIEMHNWNQYMSELDRVNVRLNMGNSPTLELIPSPVDGENIHQILTTVVQDCINALLKLYDTIGIKTGRIKVSSKPEWLVYDPVARGFCSQNGQLTIEGLGKVNASKPRHIGEIEFHDPMLLMDYLLMPQRLKSIENKLSQN